MKRSSPLQRKTPLKPSGIPSREKVRRKKRCAVCEQPFQPERDFQAVCGAVACAIAHGRSSQTSQSRARKAIDQLDRQAIKVRKEKLRSRGDFVQDATTAVQAYRRVYELSIGSGCISCGKSQAEIEAIQGWKTGGAWDGGHFLGKGARPELRLVEQNIWLQCKGCNGGSSKYARKGESVRTGFRLGLIERIGLAAVEALEADHEPRKYTIEDLKAITAKYRAMTRELKRGAA